MRVVQAGDASKSPSGIRPDPFDLAAAKQISTVGRFDGKQVSLGFPGPKPDVVFDVYGEAIRCERAASLSIIALKNVMGKIGVGICDKDATRARDAARKAEQKLAETVKDLERSLPQPGSAKAMEWEWTSQRYDGGWEGFSFPVIGIGHGIGWANTVVLWNPSNRRSVIVQADLSQLCDPNSGIRKQVQTPLCEATTKSLTDIALEVGRSS